MGKVRPSPVRDFREIPFLLRGRQVILRNALDDSLQATMLTIS
jgi:hypothetical protein